MKKILREEAILKLYKHNPKIKLIGEYVGFNNKTDFRCEKCGYIRHSTFSNILNSSRKNGCIKCEKRAKNKKKRSKSHGQYLLDVYNVWGDSINIIGQYVNSSNKIECECNVCKWKWNPEAKSLLARHGCPKCGHNRNRLSTVKKHDEYVKEVNTKHGDKINVLGEYYSNKEKILFKCNVCQHEWIAVARNIIKGRGCPKCKLNKGETKINSILENLNVEFKTQYVIENLKTEDNGTPIFDFAIFNNNVLTTIIEYDGVQHFKPIRAWGDKKRFLRQQKIDEFKNNYCVENNIKLVRIKYNELNNIDYIYIKNKIYGK